MRIIILLTSFLCLFSAFGQKISKDLYLKHAIKQDGLAYTFKVLDPDKRGVSRYRKDKFYYWFKTQKVLATQGGASGLLLHGPLEAFYDNKQLSQKGNFRKGLKDGEWIYWRMDGTIIRTEEWNKGKHSGHEKVYDATGKLATTIRYKKNSFSTRTADSLIISNNKRTEQTIYAYDSSGSLRSKVHFKNGLQEGKAKYYDQEGKPTTETYRRGQKVEPQPKTEKSGEQEKKSIFRKKDKDAQTAEKTVKERRKWFGKSGKENRAVKKDRKNAGNPEKKKFMDLFKKKKGAPEQ